MSQPDPFAAITFATGTGQLDRAAQLRDSADALLSHRLAAMLPIWQGKLLIDIAGASPTLAWVPPAMEYLAEATDRPVFLGMSEDTPCFAADFSGLGETAARKRFGAGAKFIDLRSVAGQLSPGSAGIAATAKAVVGWHLTHRFCARCGAVTEPDHGGWRRRCGACATLHFPRTDPVVIMLVVRDDHVLLGRQDSWPEGLYSLLAGFMEPGETLADAVRRETQEEAGIAVGQVRYLACQPWPFPSNLMLGCIAEAVSETITIDRDELQDAQWVSRAKVQVILDGKHPRIAPPRVDAIARTILAAWASGDIVGF